MNPEILLKRLDSLKSSEERTNFETLWQAGADYCNPANSSIITINAKGQKRTARRVTDVGIEARRKFATGMYSYAIGTGQFFNYKTSDAKLMESESVKRWFSDVDRIAMNELKASNFDAEMLQGFGELSYIGTTGVYVEWHNGQLNFKTQHISQFWIDVDARGAVNLVFVEILLTAEQFVGEFDIIPDAVKRAKDKGDRKTFRVVQVSMENEGYVEGSIIPEEKKYISLYIFADTKEIVATDGHNTFPFAVARLYKAKNEMYGRSCYMDAMQTISLHNDERLTLIRGAKLRADPPWLESSDANVRHIRNNAVSKVVYDPTALGGIPQQMDIRSDVGITESMLEMDKQTVFEAFYIPAFNPILENKNMTAYETSQRIDLGLSQISPVLNKWQREYATPMMERVFDLLLTHGKFPDVPAELDGVDFKIEYISKASLALRQIELYGIMNTYEKAAQIAQFDQSVLDVLDADEAIRLSAEVDNVPNTILRQQEDVAKIRAQRAQHEQLQQMASMAPAIADAEYKMGKIENGQG